MKRNKSVAYRDLEAVQRELRLLKRELHKRRRRHPPDRGGRKPHCQAKQAQGSGRAVGVGAQRCGGASERRRSGETATGLTGGLRSTRSLLRLLSPGAVAHLLRLPPLAPIRPTSYPFPPPTGRDGDERWRAEGPGGVEARGGQVRRRAPAPGAAGRGPQGRQRRRPRAVAAAPPTYTLGKQRKKAERNLLAPEHELRALGAEIHRTERGGDVTFHGPRQAVLYPVLSLRALGLGARRYVEGLESAMIEVAALHGVSARPGDPGETGVWVGDRKIGAVGVRISSGFTWHGLAFNIDPDLGYFEHILPCGIAGKEVTSLRREAGDRVELPADEVIHDQLVRCLARTFGFSDVEFKDGSGCGDMIHSAAGPT